MSKLVEIFYSLGKHDALLLREEAKDLTGTQIIAREMSIPQFDPEKDYTSWPIGSPVIDEDQVWILIQPYNAAHYPQRPAELRSLWGLAHTKDPAKAKPWVDAYGTSGMYMKDECYKDELGNVWRALNDNLVYDATVYPQGWEQVII